MVAKCFDQRAAGEEPALIENGHIVLQPHDIGWIVATVFTFIAIVVSAWLISKHLGWYTNKREQRQIVRILIMPPLYAIVSLASFLFWNQSTPLLLLRDCYESTVLTAFFYLLLTYISPDLEKQKLLIRANALSMENERRAIELGEPVKTWVFPLNYITKKKPEDGLYFLQIMKWGVLQYCVIRPLTTLVAVILDYVGYYCNGSWSPEYGYVYITIVLSISVTISMYCLVQVEVCMFTQLTPHKPLLKLIAIKAVVFLTFWQSTFLSVLNVFNVVKNTPDMTADNIDTGVGAILETVEMAMFSFLHIIAFTYKVYVPSPTLDNPEPEHTSRWSSFLNAMNFRDTAREIWTGSVYMVQRSKGVETDPVARRSAMRAELFGPRLGQGGKEAEPKADGLPNADLGEGPGRVIIGVEVDDYIDVDGERQWLGEGDRHVYSIGYQSRRDRSEALGIQFNKEVENRGYDGWHTADVEAGRREPVAEQGHSRGNQRSWWRRAYDRISQSHVDDEELDDDKHLLPGQPILDQMNPREQPRYDRHSRDLHDERHRKSRSRSKSRNPSRTQYDYEDNPPPSMIRAHKQTRQKSTQPQQQWQPPPPTAIIPLQERSPKRQETVEVQRVDSLLGRVFAGSDSLHSHGMSSQSHALWPQPSQSHRITLSGTPAAILTSGQAPRQSIPVVVQPTSAPQSAQGEHFVTSPTIPQIVAESPIKSPTLPLPLPSPPTTTTPVEDRRERPKAKEKRRSREPRRDKDPFASPTSPTYGNPFSSPERTGEGHRRHSRQVASPPYHGSSPPPSAPPDARQRRRHSTQVDTPPPAPRERGGLRPMLDSPDVVTSPPAPSKTLSPPREQITLPREDIMQIESRRRRQSAAATPSLPTPPFELSPVVPPLNSTTSPNSPTTRSPREKQMRQKRVADVGRIPNDSDADDDDDVDMKDAGFAATYRPLPTARKQQQKARRTSGQPPRLTSPPRQVEMSPFTPGAMGLASLSSPFSAHNYMSPTRDSYYSPAPPPAPLPPPAGAQRHRPQQIVLPTLLGSTPASPQYPLSNPYSPPTQLHGQLSSALAANPYSPPTYPYFSPARRENRRTSFGPNQATLPFSETNASPPPPATPRTFIASPAHTQRSSPLSGQESAARR